MSIIATSTTTTQYYVATSSVSASSINMMPEKVRFVPMKRHVDTSKCSASTNIAINAIDKIDDHLHISRAALYYVQNNYGNDYYSRTVTLYRFDIEKETRCFYILMTGQRIHKDLKGRTFALSPSLALKKSIARASHYLNILIRRGIDVSDFLKEVNYLRKPFMQELRNFEEIAKSFKDTNDIPLELLKPDAEKIRRDQFEYG